MHLENYGKSGGVGWGGEDGLRERVGRLNEGLTRGFDGGDCMGVDYLGFAERPF